jgi:hypothetical protein
VAQSMFLGARVVVHRALLLLGGTKAGASPAMMWK